MLKQMARKKKTVKIDPSVITPQHVAMLSPGVDASSYILKALTSLTPKKINP